MKARFLVAAAVALSALAGCEMGDESQVSPAAPQPAITVAGELGVVGAWTGDHVTANPAPEPVAEPAPAPEPVPATVPGDEPDREKSSGEVQWEWFEDQQNQDDDYWDQVEVDNGYDPNDGYWFEDGGEPTCDGAGTYGDYSPEGYADC